VSRDGAPRARNPRAALRGARPGHTLPSLAFRLAVENGTRRRRRPVAQRSGISGSASTPVRRPFTISESFAMTVP